MFQKATQKIVKEIDPDGYGLIPASSPCSEYLKPLHLIKKKKHFWYYKYTPTPFTLTDILKDGQDLDFGLQTSDVCCYSESTNSSISGDVSASIVDASISAGGGVSSTMSTVEMKKRAISMKKLFEMIKNRKINRGQRFVKQLHSDLLYIISEVVETNQQCSLNSTFNANFGLEALIKLIKVKAGIAANVEKSLSFSAGTTIAYKVLELQITPDDTLDELVCITKLYSLESESLSGIKTEIPLTELTNLSKDMSLLFLNAILEILGSCESLPVLETLLDQMCEGLQPDLRVLDLMDDKKRACVEKVLDLLGIQKADPPGQPLTLTPHQNGVIKTVDILIQSLNELNPDILILLATSVGMKIIPTQLKLLEKIEEKCFPSLACRMSMYQDESVQETEETLEILALQLTDGEFEITKRILEEFGFHLKRENTSISYDSHDERLQTSDVCCYSKGTSSSISGDVSASIDDASISAGGGVSSTMSTVEMKKRAISMKKLLEMIKNRKINRGQRFVKQLHSGLLYIISEVVETNQSYSLNSTFNANFGLEALIKLIKVKGGVAANVEKSLSFSAGTTIAYKFLELQITPDDTLDVYWEKLFSTFRFALPLYQKADILLTDLTKLNLSKDMSLLFLNAILEILGSSENLPVLETLLDQMCEGLQPDLRVLDMMDDKNRACVEKVLDLLGIQKADPPGQPLTLTPHQNGVIKTVDVLIQSLNELNPDTLILLATSVEMKIIPTQLKLLEKIEEECFQLTALVTETDQARSGQETEETLEILALQLTDGEFETTKRILEEFGFHLKRENASISYDIDGKKDTFFHIFAALYILSALNN